MVQHPVFIYMHGIMKAVSSWYNHADCAFKQNSCYWSYKFKPAKNLSIEKQVLGPRNTVFWNVIWSLIKRISLEISVDLSASFKVRMAKKLK